MVAAGIVLALEQVKKALQGGTNFLVAQDADGIINQYAPITRRVIESLKRCKVIARYGVGVDNIDVEAATEHKIIVANVPDYCVDEVSTHTIALILACARGITLLDRKIRDKKWDFTLAKPLFRTQGKTLGLFGLGRIAKMVAQKASGFGFKIIAYDPYVSKVDGGIRLVEFSQLLSDSDFISIHAPLTVETRHSFGENELKDMKKTAYLINTSRGPFSLNNSVYDMFIALVFGIIGYIMKKNAFPVAPVVLGVILGPIAEDELGRALIIAHGDWTVLFQSPIAIFFYAISLLSLLYSLKRQFSVHLKTK